MFNSATYLSISLDLDINNCVEVLDLSEYARNKNELKWIYFLYSHNNFWTSNEILDCVRAQEFHKTNETIDNIFNENKSANSLSWGCWTVSINIK